jgi:PAS domain S-box-containing protein
MSRLQISEQRFARFFETLPEYCYLISPDGSILDVNPAACEALGYRREELVGKSLTALYAPESHARIRELFEKWRREGALRDEEMVILTKRGQKRTVLLTAGSVRDASGKLLHSTSVQVDITERKQVEERLRESESRLEAIVASAMDAVLAIDEQQRIVVFNAAAEKMFGCATSDAIGSPVDRFIPERFRAAHRTHIRHFGDTGVTFREMGAMGTLWGLRTNGEEFPIEASISKAKAGGRELLTVIIRDVTERLQVVGALKRSEERSRELVLRSPIPMVVTRGPNYENELANLKFAELFGYTIDDVPNETSWWPLAYPDAAYREAVKAEWRQRVEKAARLRADIEPLEADVRCKDGTVRHTEFHFSSFGDTSLVSFVDLTGRHRAELALRESEARFRLVANTAPVMIWMSGLDGKPTYFNQLWLDFTGHSETELQNDLAALVHPEDCPRCADIYREAFAQRRPFRKECRLRRGDGQYRWILDIGVPRFREDGSFAGYIGSCLDITEQKLAEEARSKMSQMVIEAQDQERRWMARELHDDISQRISLLAFNLKTLQQNLPPSRGVLRERLEQEYALVSELASDVAALSHRLHSSTLQRMGLVTAAAAYCREFSRRQKLQIEFSSEGTPEKIPDAISLCLFRVLQEALQNAAKHSGATRLQVQLVGAANEIVLTVHDEGRGFDLGETLAETGLGITSMKERLKLVDGHLSIDSKLQGGTTIRAHVPLSPRANSARAGA